MIRVLLVEGHSFLRQGLKALLEVEPDFVMVGESRGGLETVQMIHDIRPDVALMDLTLPHGRCGLSMALDVRRLAPEVSIIMLGCRENQPLLLEALRAGLNGYILKDTPSALIPLTVRSSVQGAVLCLPELLQRLFLHVPRSMDIPSTCKDLTPREREFMRLLSRGYRNAAIAQTLNLAESTVKKYVHTLMRKVGATDRAEVAYLGVRLGLSVDL